MIRKLNENDLLKILELNNKYKKEYHSNNHNTIFKGNPKNNCSYGLFIDGQLEEYIVAYKDNKNINIENFIWKKSENYIEMMNLFFDYNKSYSFNMYICDKGLVVFLKIIQRYFSKEYCFNLEKKVKKERNGELLNYISFKIYKNV